MPTINVYLKDRIYWKVSMEADKMGMTPGKFIGMLVENYFDYIEKKEVENGKEEVPSGS